MRFKPTHLSLNHIFTAEQPPTVLMVFGVHTEGELSYMNAGRQKDRANNGKISQEVEVK